MIGRPLLRLPRAACNARRVDEGRALRVEIRSLLATHLGPGATSSIQILLPSRANLHRACDPERDARLNPQEGGPCNLDALPSTYKA
jgi:hypothetical protein